MPVRKNSLLPWLPVIILLNLAGCSSENTDVAVEEKFRADEAAQAQRAVENFRRIVDENRVTYVGRGAHAKGHSCVKAWFKVSENIDRQYQHGVLATPGRQYKAWIRFSNANSNYAESRDINKDAHGMAIKLLGIDKQPLTVAGDAGPPTQDFLMADNPNFFSANIDDYNRFLEADNYINFFFNGLNPFNWRLREFFIALETLKEPPGSPLWISYFSNTAYKLGPHNIKFSAEPCRQGKSRYPASETDPDFMRHNLSKELTEMEGCFSFNIQVQDPQSNMPIEDPSVEWDESVSPYVPVARLTIPVQETATQDQMQFCENLSFSPWHALEAHRPIGQFNRIRKPVYRASSDYRHDQNNMPVPVDISW